MLRRCAPPAPRAAAPGAPRRCTLHTVPQPPPRAVLPSAVPRPAVGFAQHLRSVQFAPLVAATLPAPLTAPGSTSAVQDWVAAPEMEECAVPKKKRSIRRNRIRRSSKMPEPVTHIGRCASCGKLKLRHIVCGSCGGMTMTKSV